MTKARGEAKADLTLGCKAFGKDSTAIHQATILRDDATIAMLREKAEKKTRKKAEMKERMEHKRTRKEGVKAGKASPKKRKR